MLGSAEEGEYQAQVHAPHVRDTVLAVGGEDVVAAAQRVRGADLGPLLSQGRRPEPELALSLQRGGLRVEGAGEDHVAVHGSNEVIGQLRDVRGERLAPGTLATAALGIENLEHRHVRGGLQRGERIGQGVLLGDGSG